MKDFYIVRLCKSTAAYEAIPKKNLKLNLDKCEKKFIDMGYRVINAKVMLVVDGEIETTVFPSGKLLVKTDDKTVAESTVIKYSTILLEN